MKVPPGHFRFNNMGRRDKRFGAAKEGGGQGALIKDLEKYLSIHFEEKHTKNLLIKQLRLSRPKEIGQLSRALDILQSKGHIEYLDSETFVCTLKPKMVEGVVDWVNPRYAFLVVEGVDKDYILPVSSLNGALDGDTVKARVMGSSSYMRGREEAEVLEVIKRKRLEFVGRFQEGRANFVIPDSKKIHVDFFIESAHTMGATNQQKVVVAFQSWGSEDRNPIGKVVKILGKSGENETEIHSIMAEYGLPIEFPEEVLAESKLIEERIDPEEIAKRRDFRDILTVTIDPEDAKDFDDALSFRFLDNSRFEIGVHIADVSHFVRPRTKLEEEAYNRATSVYLVDRVVPMLPENLSNNICSLVPNKDRLTFGVVFEMDLEGRLHNQWFGRTVIHSDKRFSYEEVQHILEAKEGLYSQELNIMNDIALALRKKRFQQGAINFETVEVKFKLDQNGKPLGVYPKVRKDAHKMIEEYMLLANKKVAEFVFNYKNGKQKNLMVYRTHDAPDPEKLRSFSLFAKKLGYSLDADSKNISRELNGLMTKIEGKPEQNVLENLAVRSMPKAKYTTNSLGHFGLAFEHYSHFTSPIRRYPDLMAHRLLQLYLDDLPPSGVGEWEERCKHSTDKEKQASDAERASIKFKQAEYLSTMIGRSFEGLISGVTEWGVFVEIIENRCEGLVRYQDIKHDVFEPDVAALKVVGRKSGKVLTLGDKVTVSVKNTDIDRRTIDFVMLSDE